MPSILVIGAGAVGAFFGSALARQGARVSVVCRSDYAVVKQNGYDIRSNLLGDHRFVPQQTFQSASEAGDAFDYVVLATKVLESVDRIALLKATARPGATIVLLQNGVDIESEVAAALPDNELISAIAFIAVSRTAPGRVHHQSEGSLVIGRYPHGGSARAEELAAMFKANAIPCKVTQDVVAARWQKALWNAAFNPISIMGGVLDTAAILRTPESRRFIRDTMVEIAATAHAAGHPIDEAVIDKLIEGTRAMPPYKTSMALDFEHGREMEIEAILGNVVRTARRLGQGVPRLETIYSIAKMIEGAPRAGRT
ncbi:MAG: 2-dehydropantoate 2-reductase [Xanthomonadaceae bacterium]|nr:2-dehydropantoate 2-reductase [Xanthomonadaceae bacterium]